MALIYNVLRGMYDFRRQDLGPRWRVAMNGTESTGVVASVSVKSGWGHSRLLLFAANDRLPFWALHHSIAASPCLF